MSEEYNVFISWSGPRSKWVAEAMRDWLPLVVQAAKPWMSATDIEKGSRGLSDISSRLSNTKVGVVCLTPENLNAPWILYEAGALSKAIDDKTRLCTYLLCGLRFQDVNPPLGMFQATNPDKEDTRQLLRTINKAVSANPLPDQNLDRLFERMWTELKEKLNTIPDSSEVTTTKRLTEDMVAEILNLARAQANVGEEMEARIEHIERTLNRAPFGDYSTLLGETHPDLNALGPYRSPLVGLSSLYGTPPEKKPPPLSAAASRENTGQSEEVLSDELDKNSPK